jgi:hypothetical protein
MLNLPNQKSTITIMSKLLHLIYYRYNFHILKDAQILYVCIAAISFKNKAAFAFLN